MRHITIGIILSSSVILGCSGGGTKAGNGPPGPRCAGDDKCLGETWCLTSGSWMSSYNSGKNLANSCIAWPTDGKKQCGESAWGGWAPKEGECGEIIGVTPACDPYAKYYVFLSIDGHCVATQTTDLAKK